MKSLSTSALSALLCLLATGCGSDTTSGKTEDVDAGSDASVVVVPPAHLAITADWVNGTLSYVDRDALTTTAKTRKDALSSTVDLSKYSPGPLALELTPDAKRLLVATSAGFFSISASSFLLGGATVPTGPGKLLIIDVASGEIEKELTTGNGPTGIAITPDGKRAFVAHFDSGDMAIVDLVKNEVTSTVKIGQYAEEVTLDDTGTVGVVGFSAQGSVRTFSVDDPAGTMTTVTLKGDSGGIAFFPGTKIAFVVEAPNPLSLAPGHVLLDVNDPKAPKVLAQEIVQDLLVAYPAQAHKKRKSVLVPVTDGTRLKLREYTLDGKDLKLAQTIDITDGNLLEVLGFGHDGEDTVFMADPQKRRIITTNLTTQKSRIVDWEQKKAGPADVVIVP